MTDDSWKALKRFTPARIAIGRAGASRTTRELLSFRLAHAEAVDAVQSPLDGKRLRADLEKEVPGIELVDLESAALDGGVFLRRPDLGRRLSDESRAVLGRRVAARSSTDPVDVCIVLADGLAAMAIQRYGPTLLRELVALLSERSLTLAPVSLVTRGRVAVMDEIGSAWRASVALILLGERPGLQSPDSLGAYLEFAPRPGRSDAERNCVSNIRAGGLDPALAAKRLAWLINEALRRQLSGVALKDEADLGVLPRV